MNQPDPPKVIPVAPDGPAGEDSWKDPPPPSGTGPSKTWEIPDDEATQSVLAAWYSTAGIRWL